jgi:hypothetical protein
MSSGSSKVVDHLEEIYNTKYRPASQVIFKEVPKHEDETTFEHAVRVAAVTRVNIDVSNAMDALCSAGTEFIRHFRHAYEQNQDECRAYFDNSGLARLTNVFIMLFPYEVLKWCRCRQGVSFPEDFKPLFPIAAKDSETMMAWVRIMRPESLKSVEPFPEATIKALLAMDPLV